ncbi:MAG: cobalt-zinc-cadmium efflux system outer membrane protein [Crocinitomicaceae bacterium]|jgi:cobalt-zinc-cadmium efflux system outer membrane protein
MKAFTIGLTLSGVIFLNSCRDFSGLNIVTAIAEEPDMSLGNTGPIDQSSSLSLKQIAKRVSANNPQLRAARLRVNQAQGQVVQSGRLTNPELELDLNKNVRGSEGGLEVTFAQRFPITNRLRVEKRISNQQLSIAKEEVKVAQKSLTSQAQVLAIEILHNRQRAQFLNKQSVLLDEFADFIDVAAGRGELSSLDANQAKIESATLKSEISAIKTREKISLNKLRSYIGLSPNRLLELSGNLPSATIPSTNLALSNRPEYRAKLLEIEQAKDNIALQKANRYQDIEGRLFTSYDREEDAPNGLENEGTIGAGINIPLQFYNKNEGNIQTARAQASRIASEKTALALQIQQQVATERAEMKSWLSQTSELTKNLIPLADSNAEQLEEAYRNGQAPFTSVLKARSQQLKLQSQNIDNLEAFHKARVRYFAAIGREQSAL